jgi:quercetin dioxygenase-like cupin family protein
MDRDSFNRSLAAEGFPPGVLVVREANGFVDLHAHPYEAKALVLGGELRIVVDGITCTYGAGQVFHLAPNLPHREYYGPQGVEFLVGRKEVG